MQVSKGFSTWAGTVGAVAGFLLAVSVFMDTFDELDPLAGLGPLLGAAAVLWKVIDGRMKQATALAAKSPAPVAYLGTGSTGTNVASSWTTPPARDPYAGSIPAGSVPAEEGQ